MAVVGRNHGIWVSSFIPLGYKFLNSPFIFFLYFLRQSAVYPIHQRTTLQQSLSPNFKMSTPHLESYNIQQAITLLLNIYEELQRHREEWRRYQDIQEQLLVELRARFVFHLDIDFPATVANMYLFQGPKCGSSRAQWAHATLFRHKRASDSISRYKDRRRH